jgi:hypothetical protein
MYSHTVVAQVKQHIEQGKRIRLHKQRRVPPQKMLPMLKSSKNPVLPDTKKKTVSRPVKAEKPQQEKLPPKTSLLPKTNPFPKKDVLPKIHRQELCTKEAPTKN